MTITFTLKEKLKKVTIQMAKVLADIICEPEFVETDGAFKVGEEVWAVRWESWVLGTIKQIRYDSGLKMSRYRVVTPHSDFWSSKVEARFIPAKTTTTTKKSKESEKAGAYSEEGYLHGMGGYDW
jgi:hypothetical protein